MYSQIKAGIYKWLRFHFGTKLVRSVKVYASEKVLFCLVFHADVLYILLVWLLAWYIKTLLIQGEITENDKSIIT